MCNLKDHIKKRHTTKLKCTTCKRGFPNDEELNSHVCKHFKCDLCDQKFIQHRNLAMHKREHAGETFHHCDFCEGMFHSKRRMLAHRRYNHTNTNGESHECDICNKKFSILRILKRHRLIHISGILYNISSLVFYSCFLFLNLFYLSFQLFRLFLSPHCPFFCHQLFCLFR